MADHLFKGGLGTTALTLKKATVWLTISHTRPQHAVLRARGFVHVVDLRASRPMGDLLIIRHNGLRDAIDTPPNGSNAHGEAEHGLAKVLHSPVRRSAPPEEP